MQVLDDDHGGPVSRQVAEQSGEGGVEPVSIRLRRCVVCRRQGRDPIRGSRDVDERTEWATRINLSALAPENSCTFRACLLGEVTEHGRLAYASLARHEDGPAPAAESFAEERLEPAHFGLAADQDGAKDPPIRHRTSVFRHVALPALDSVTRSSASASRSRGWMGPRGSAAPDR